MSFNRKPVPPSPTQVDLEEVIAHHRKSDPKTGKAVLDSRGHEILNPTPIEPPLGYVRQVPLVEQIRQAVRAERQALEDLEPDTFEESQDFDIDEDPAVPSKWENDAEPSINELRRKAREAGFRYNPQSHQLEPIEPEGSHPEGRSEAEEARQGLDGLEAPPSSKKPRGVSPAASKAPKSASGEDAES